MAGQIWVTDSVGGFMYSDNLSKELRHAVQPLVKYRQFCDVKDAAMQGKGKGDTYHWNVYSDIATQGTTLVETTVMPESNFVISQGTMTITEYGNSVPFTQKLDDLSEHPVREIVHKVLKNDAKRAFDIAAHAQFDATPLRIVPLSATDTGSIVLTTNGTATGTNNVALGKNHIKSIVDTMKERNLPPFINDDYMAIGRPTSFRQLKNDLEGIHQYVNQGFQMILNGEIGRYEGMRFVEQTGIATESWSNSLSDAVHFFGDDTVAEGISVPEELRGKIPGDYGRSRGVALTIAANDAAYRAAA